MKYIFLMMNDLYMYILFLLQQEALQQQTDAMAREATDIAADCVPPNVDTGKAMESDLDT